MGPSNQRRGRCWGGTDNRAGVKGDGQEKMQAKMQARMQAGVLQCCSEGGSVPRGTGLRVLKRPARSKEGHGEGWGGFSRSLGSGTF